MKILLPYILLALATTFAAVAQQLPVDLPQKAPSAPFPVPTVAVGELELALPVTQDYLWFSRIYRNTGARFYPFVPYKFAPRAGGSDTVEWRGVGEIFAPAVNYSFYSGSVYNIGSSIYYDTTDGGESDQDYIDQYLDAGAFTIDSMQLFVYENAAAGLGGYDGKLLLLRTDVDFAGAEYQSLGFAKNRSELPVVYERTLGRDLLNEASGGNDSIFATRIRFTPQDNIRFARGESAVVVYVNETAPAVGPDNIAVNADVQQLYSQLEWKDGSRGTPDTRKNPLPDYKSLGVVLYRDKAGNDRLLSGFKSLTFEEKPGIFDLNMVFWGTLEMGSGVHYHFGTKGSSSGSTLGEATPNPVRTTARIPFSLAHGGQVTIDLYDITGAHRLSLVKGSYPAGAYSCDLPAEALSPGSYVVRMITGKEMTARRLVIINY